jgi:hypothetical protein
MALRFFQPRRPLGHEGCEESLNVRRENNSAHKRLERREACGDISQDLHGRRVELYEVSPAVRDVFELPRIDGGLFQA